MSQVKKYQSGTDGGGIKPLATTVPKLRFQIDGKDYDADSQSLQDMFNPVFDNMKATGVAKERNREDFFKTFQQFQKQASSGVYNIKSSGGKYLTADYTGADGANLGTNPDGSDSHKTTIGNLISPFSRDDHQRMAMLNTYIGDHLIQNYTKDQDAAKIKADADAAKLLSDKTAARDEYIGKFDQYRKPNTAIFGSIDGKDDKWAYDKFWQGKGQTHTLQGTFGKIGGYLFDKQLDDADAQTAFKKAYGITVGDARNAFTQRSFADGKFGKNPEINDMIGLAGDLQVRRDYDSYFNKRPVEATPEQVQAQADKAAAAKAAQLAKDSISDGHTTYYDPTTGQAFMDKAHTKPFSGFMNHAQDPSWNGLYFENGKRYSGIRAAGVNFDNKDDMMTGAFEDNQNGFYWDGKLTDRHSFYSNANNSSDKSIINTAQSVNQALMGIKNNYHTNMVDLSRNGENGFDEDNTSPLFAFKDYVASKKPLPRATEISAKYPAIFGHEDERLYAYEVPGSDRFGNDNLVRYRFRSRTGKVIDGVIKKDVDGTHYLTDGKTNVRLGMFDPQGQGQRAVPFTGVKYNNGVKEPQKEVMYHGAVIKQQLGGSLNNTVSSNQFQSAQTRNGWEGMSEADKYELGAIGAQIGSVIAGFVPVPGATVASTALGLGGTGLDAVANYKKHGFKWGDVGGTLAGAGLDLAASLPVFGEAASLAKLGKYIKGSAKLLQGSFAAMGAYGALHSLAKFNNDEHLTIDDWKNIAGGIQGAVAGKRMIDRRVATTANTENLIKIDGKNVPIGAEQASAILAASPSQRLNVAKEQLKDSGFDLSKIDVSAATTQSFVNKYSRGLFGRNEKPEMPLVSQESNGRKLIDFDNANWYQRRAIKNVVAQSPGIAGAENYTINRRGLNTQLTAEEQALNPGARVYSESIPASQGKTRNWMENRWKVVYNPEAVSNKPTVGPTPTGPQGSLYTPAISGAQRALPVSTGKVTGGSLMRTKDGAMIMGQEEPRPGIVEDKVSEFAGMGKVYNSLRKLDGNKDESSATMLGNVKLGPKGKGSSTGAINDNHEIAQVRESLGIKEGSKARRDVVTSLFRDNMSLTKEQQVVKNKFMATKFAKGSVGDKLQQQILTAYTHKARKGFVKFSLGGSVPMHQSGNAINILGSQGFKSAIDGWNDLIMPKNTTERNDPLNLGLKWAPTQLDIANTVTAGGAGQFLSSNAQQLATPPTSVIPAQVKGRANGAQRGNSGITLNGLIPKDLDLNTVSELGRALFTRQLNSQIDTRVERPMISAPVETPVAVKGNLYATMAANNQANRIIQASRNLTSDGMLQTGATLDANQRAGQLRMQGELQNIDALNRSGQMAQQSQMQAAQQRSQVANQNIQTNARATQAERAAENDKFGRMNQPLVDFWKDQNYKQAAQAQQDKLYDTQIALANKQTEFSTAMKPMTDQLNMVQQKQQQLEYKQQYGGGLDANETKQLNDLINQGNELNNKFGIYQGRYGINALQTRKNIGYATPAGLYTDIKKEGGAITNKTRVAIQESKDNAANARKTAEIQQETIKSDADNETKRNLQTAKQISDLIMKALS